MKKIKNCFKNMNRNQIVCIASSIGVLTLTLCLVALKVFVFPTKAIEEPVINEMTTVETTKESTTYNDYFFFETESETETETETETTETTSHYKANTDIKVSVATGNKEDDEDKGNNHIDNSSSDGKPIEEHTEATTNANITTVVEQTNPPQTTEIETENSIPEITESPSNSNNNIDISKSFKSKYSNFSYINCDNFTGWKNINNTNYFFDNNFMPLKGLQKINGRNYYFNEYNALSSLFGIDVSRWNGEIDWNKVKNDGVDYAIIRVGFRGYGSSGNIKVDNTYEKNITEATKQNIPVGLYFFSQATTVEEALEEAGVCVNYARGHKITYPIYFDTEFATSNFSGRADNLTKEQRTEIAIAFCEAIKNAGYTPGIYASKKFYYDELEYNKISKYEIWLAHYTKNETNFKNPFKMWQYSSESTIDGIPERTDINISYYDYNAKSNMKNRGYNNIISNSNEIKTYQSAENAISNYENNCSSSNYDLANNLISNIKNIRVKNTLVSVLNKIKEKNTPETTESQTESDTTILESSSTTDISSTNDVSSTTEITNTTEISTLPEFHNTTQSIITTEKNTTEVETESTTISETELESSQSDDKTESTIIQESQMDIVTTEISKNI